MYLILVVLLVIIVVFISSSVTFKIAKEEFNDKIKLDVSLAQMKESEQKINLFVSENKIEDNFSINRIAEILKVKQGGVEKGIDNQAYLKEDNTTGEKIVVFKEGLSESEKNFVFAHEIAHLLNVDSIPVTRPIGRNKAQIEQLADYTAAALLMPVDSVFNFLKDNSYLESSARKRMVLVRQLCKSYRVTEMIVLRRIKEVYALRNENDS